MSRSRPSAQESDLASDGTEYPTASHIEPSIERVYAPSGVLETFQIAETIFNPRFDKACHMRDDKAGVLKQSTTALVIW